MGVKSPKGDGGTGPIVTRDKDGNWPSAEDWPLVQRMAVCSTSDCPMEGIGFDIPVACSADGNLTVMCHQCQTLITDLRLDLTPVGEGKRARLLANPEEFARRQDRVRKRKLKEQLIKQRAERAARIEAEKNPIPVPISDVPTNPTKEI